ncbi:MAG: hypothetical protein AB7F28_06180 [Candidatus Margulisiibacteriota bacterium]
MAAAAVAPVGALPLVPGVPAAAPAGVGGNLRAQIVAGLQGIQGALANGPVAAEQAARAFLARPDLNFGPVVNPFVAAHRMPAPVIAPNGAVAVPSFVLPGLPTGGSESGIPILHELLRADQYQNLVPVFLRLLGAQDAPEEAQQLVLYDSLYGQSELLKSSRVLDDEALAALSTKVRKQQENNASLREMLVSFAKRSELRRDEASAAVALARQRAVHLEELGRRVDALAGEVRGRSNSDPVSPLRPLAGDPRYFAAPGVSPRGERSNSRASASSSDSAGSRSVSPSSVALDAIGTGSPTVARAAALAVRSPHEVRDGATPRRAFGASARQQTGFASAPVSPAKPLACQLVPGDENALPMRDVTGSGFGPYTPVVPPT